MFCAFWALDIAPTLDVLVLFHNELTQNQNVYKTIIKKRQKNNPE